jgi:hypothetical protein
VYFRLSLYALSTLLVKAPNGLQKQDIIAGKQQHEKSVNAANTLESLASLTER